MASDTAAANRCQVPVLGAGTSGLCMAIALRRSGIDDFVVLEKPAGIGAPRPKAGFTVFGFMTVKARSLPPCRGQLRVNPPWRLLRRNHRRPSASPGAMTNALPARAQCTSSCASCDEGCAGAAVVGALSVPAGKGAGANPATAVVEQCSAHCDTGRSQCEEQVSPLDSEKVQAVAQAQA